MHWPTASFGWGLSLGVDLGSIEAEPGRIHLLDVSGAPQLLWGGSLGRVHLWGGLGYRLAYARYGGEVEGGRAWSGPLVTAGARLRAHERWSLGLRLEAGYAAIAQNAPAQLSEVGTSTGLWIGASLTAGVDSGW